MLAVLEVRLNEVLPFLSIDDEEDDDGAGGEDARAEALLDDEYRCFF